MKSKACRKTSLKAIARFTILMPALVITTSCSLKKVTLKEEDKIFHAGQPESGFGVTFFGLYKDKKYMFCEGDFIDPGCYTGDFKLSGDTITLYDLKKHSGIPSNRFLIQRLNERDRFNGSEGKVFPLDPDNQVVDDGRHYFLIRLDRLKTIR